ncbi:MAG: zinc ribbon domain-containing protein [Chloroflexi bacterium]|nr:zinc ribbon domain-containing protein [Chloroflexota bacterium]
MRRAILWIVTGVVILAILVAVPLLGRVFFGGFGGRLVERGSFGYRPPMMGFYGFPFFPFGMILGWLIPLGLIVLVVLAAIEIGRSLGRSNSVAQATISQVPPAAAPAPTPARTCAHCGKPAQADWTTCPYCGSQLS